MQLPGRKIISHLFYVLSCLLTICFLASCTKNNSDEIRFKYKKKYKDKALAVTVEISELKITTADRITLRISVQSPKNQDPEFPSHNDFSKTFIISDNSITEPKPLKNGDVFYEQDWLLEPELPGEITVPLLKITAGNSVIETQAVAIQVESMLPVETAGLTIKDIAEPMSNWEESEENSSVLTYTIIGLVIIFLIAITIFQLRKKSHTQILPHELALLELKKLQEQQLLENGEYLPFYRKLSFIIRQYIQTRYEITVLGRTSSEFLKLALAGNYFSQTQCDFLNSFFANCDLVKFAHTETANHQDTLHACENFITETAIKLDEDTEADA